METSTVATSPNQYPVTFSVDYPERQLNRLTTFFRIFTVIPIAIIIGLLPGGSVGSYGDYGAAIAAGSLIFAPIVLMLLFKKKYPRWWYDWNLEFLRFGNRIGVYLALMDDEYPSTDEMQRVHLDFPYPDAERLERGLPLVKWLLAIPHYIVLFFLSIGVFFAVIGDLVRDPLHRPLPARPLQLHRGHDPLAQPRRRLRLHPRHRRVPTVPAERLIHALR